MSTDFENTSVEKNAIISEKPVRRWRGSKSCISGSSATIKLKLSQFIHYLVTFKQSYDFSGFESITSIRNGLNYISFLN